MGRRGPIAKSQHLKVLQGTFRHDRASSPGIQLPAEVIIPRPPMKLSPEARKEWKLRARQLTELGLLNKLFVAAFCILCEELALWRKVNKELQEKGVTYLTKRGLPRIHPLVSVERKVWGNCVNLMRDFALTPTSARRLGVKIEAPRKPSAFDRFLDDAG